MNIYFHNFILFLLCYYYWLNLKTYQLSSTLICYIFYDIFHFSFHFIHFVLVLIIIRIFSSFYFLFLHSINYLIRCSIFVHIFLQPKCINISLFFHCFCDIIYPIYGLLRFYGLFLLLCFNAILICFIMKETGIINFNSFHTTFQFLLFINS